MGREGKIKILLVDDQTLMLEGLETLLSIRAEIQIVGKAQTGEEALESLRLITPNLILMDIRMPGMGGVKATEAIKKLYPSIVILILTTFDDDEYIIEALSNGASGYLLKDIDGEKLVQSIYEALSGSLLLTGKVAHKLALNIRNNNNRLDKIAELLTFTQREIDLAKLLVDGFNTKEIAEKLYLTQGTVKNYLSVIYSKIGTNDRTKAVLILKKHLSS
ncbi:response regulator transcription factor [Paenibacillus sp. GSMTC-2017]|uniref:response regulator transcription factor n=1 Tax=Paenibacillus sp. GSMTC-2017 TaxID=2794350 RepID=UPI0018D859E2|nr:response regulator transcription factor [Paenibacillus sp. GSMTC-2017]MBH5316217.1 response regulator transcription factor [Paenibacillus sp. GSMTC-2017]